MSQVKSRDQYRSQFECCYFVKPLRAKLKILSAIKLVVFWTVVALGQSVHASDFTVEPNSQLTLKAAILTAQQNDPYSKKLLNQQNIALAQSDIASANPDPQLSMAIANLPVGSFSLDSEPMTQVKVGYSQMFARGDTLDLAKEQFRLLSQSYPLLYQDRMKKIAIEITHLWLDLYRAKESLRILSDKQTLFSQLSDIAASQYATTASSAQQQDIIQAQLAVSKFQEREIKWRQRLNTLTALLNEFLVCIDCLQPHDFIELEQFKVNLSKQELEKLFSLNKTQSTIKAFDEAQLVAFLQQLPQMTALDKKILSQQQSVAIAREADKSKWAVNASYGFRQDDPLGNRREDFISVGFVVELPTNSKRVDGEALKAAHEVANSKSEKALVLRQLLTEIKVTLNNIATYQQQKTLFENSILPQTHENAEIATLAYSNGQADFSQLILARIEELNAQLEYVDIATNYRKAKVSLSYFSEPNVTSFIQTDLNNQESNDQESKNLKLFSQKSIGQNSFGQKFNAHKSGSQLSDNLVTELNQ